jgi:ribose 1,5-bisphosphate isomerase
LWSVVTGYLEPRVEPLAQALDEIREELGLSPPGLALVCDLQPVALTSPSSGKQFLVYPFLFECEGTDQVVLNWEHDEVAWVEPSRLEAADCVQWQPPLVRALLASRRSAHRQ